MVSSIKGSGHKGKRSKELLRLWREEYLLRFGDDINAASLELFKVEKAKIDKDVAEKLAQLLTKDYIRQVTRKVIQPSEKKVKGLARLMEIFQATGQPDDKILDGLFLRSVREAHQPQEYLTYDDIWTLSRPEILQRSGSKLREKAKENAMIHWHNLLVEKGYGEQNHGYVLSLLTAIKYSVDCRTGMVMLELAVAHEGLGDQFKELYSIVRDLDELTALEGTKPEYLVMKQKRAAQQATEDDLRDKYSRAKIAHNCMMDAKYGSSLIAPSFPSFESWKQDRAYREAPVNLSGLNTYASAARAEMWGVEKELRQLGVAPMRSAQRLF